MQTLGGDERGHGGDSVATATPEHPWTIASMFRFAFDPQTAPIIG